MISLEKKQFEQFLRDFQDVIDNRYMNVYTKLCKTKKYKDLTSVYNYAFKEVSKKCDRNTIEKFVETIYDISSLENQNLYMQGFIDGILFKENMQK